MKWRVSDKKQVEVAKTPLPQSNSVTVKKKNKLNIVAIAVSVLTFSVTMFFVVPRFIDTKSGSNTSQESTKVQDQSTALLKEAAPYLDDSKDIENFSKVVAKIQALPEYIQNPNLMYVLTYFDLVVGDLKLAQENLALLKAVYKTDVGYDEIIRSKTLSNDILDKRLAFLTNQTEQFKKNTILIPAGVPKQ